MAPLESAKALLSIRKARVSIADRDRITAYVPGFVPLVVGTTRWSSVQVTKAKGLEARDCTIGVGDVQTKNLARTCMSLALLNNCLLISCLGFSKVDHQRIGAYSEG
jgi:hypothetical protein